MQVTINDVRYAVHAALDNAFPGIKVSGEEIKQNLNHPRFFVRLLEPAHTQELGNRYKRDLPFAIRYFAADRANADMYNMAEQLTSVLKWITVGGRHLPGQSMSFQIVDEVLHFFVTYQMLVYEKHPEGAKMMTLKQEGYLHG